MKIPALYQGILDKNKGMLANDATLKPFIDKCFKDLFAHFKGLSFQSRAKKSGDMFEFLFYYVMNTHFGVKMDFAIPIKKACMEGAGSLDFGINGKSGKLVCGMEAKGSAEVVGKIKLLRPALKRTDTMKKAIAQAYQFKRTFPSVPFYIITNVKPTSGNAKCMMDLAEGDIIDKVYDVTNPKELKELVAKLKAFKRRA
ncbi:MAG TPA: hypothetical protein VJK07_03750 [Candidatus Nanoarchaeia archaeon]|nr:hypothetical protein [Candidatus Nanoarchaeia archaeon]